MLSIWQRLPVVVRAIVAGVATTAAGTLPWVLLVLSNQRVLRTVPWALLPMAVFLWLYWRYLHGEGWPRATAAARPSGTMSPR